MATITPTVTGPSFRGAPVLSEVPTSIALAVARYFATRAIADNAKARYQLARADANAATSRSWLDLSRRAKEASADVAWTHKDEAEKRHLDAYRELERAIEGACRYYLIRGHLFGFAKRPHQGKSGLQLVIWGPGEFTISGGTMP
jgi:hypothetical protein